MRTIHLEPRNVLSDRQAAGSLPGRMLRDGNAGRVLQETATVYKPDGTLLLIFIKNAISPAAVKQAGPELRRIHGAATNRGMATGLPRRLAMRADGKQSNTNIAPTADTFRTKKISSAIIGFFDRYPRFPFCRQTAFNMNEPERFARIIPLTQEVSEAFHRYHKERWAAQQEICSRTHPDWVIPGTVFTTITVNKNFPTGVHKDGGDFRKGFGVLTAFEFGKYRGFYTAFPQYGVSVDLRDGDLLLADVHEWHGNTPAHGMLGQYERVSCVFYYREKMLNCLSAAEELERAKHLRSTHGVHTKETKEIEAIA